MQTKLRLPPRARAQPEGLATPAVISQQAEVACARPDPSGVCSSPRGEEGVSGGASLEGPRGGGLPAVGQEAEAHGVLVPLAACPPSKEPLVQSENLTSQVMTDSAGSRPRSRKPGGHQR